MKWTHPNAGSSGDNYNGGADASLLWSLDFEMVFEKYRGTEMNTLTRLIVFVTWIVISNASDAGTRGVVSHVKVDSCNVRGCFRTSGTVCWIKERDGIWYLLTNAHLFPADSMIKAIYVGRGLRPVGRLVCLDRDRDLALIAARMSDSQPEWTFGPTPSDGETVWLAAKPRDNPFRATRQLTGGRLVESGCYGISGPIPSGASGGCVVDASDRLVGMLASTSTDECFAIPASSITEFLRGCDLMVAAIPVPAGSVYPPNAKPGRDAVTVAELESLKKQNSKMAIDLDRLRHIVDQMKSAAATRQKQQDALVVLHEAKLKALTTLAEQPIDVKMVVTGKDGKKSVSVESYPRSSPIVLEFDARRTIPKP